MGGPKKRRETKHFPPHGTPKFNFFFSHFQWASLIGPYKKQLKIKIRKIPNKYIVVPSFLSGCEYRLQEWNLGKEM
jgi:hypothetical protein